ncbi:MAG: hypothetical protein AB7E80_01170 [Hyphomicrobiaceae bacterium]
MPLRFKVLSIVFLLMLLGLQEEQLKLFETYHAVAGLLAVLLVFSVIALWPNSSRVDRVDRAMSGEGWADRIKFEDARSVRRDA